MAGMVGLLLPHFPVGRKGKGGLPVRRYVLLSIILHPACFPPHPPRFVDNGETRRTLTSPWKPARIAAEPYRCKHSIRIVSSHSPRRPHNSLGESACLSVKRNWIRLLDFTRPLYTYSVDFSAYTCSARFSSARLHYHVATRPRVSYGDGYHETSRNHYRIRASYRGDYLGI